MELRKTFNEDAANYDRYRPDYPREMMDEIAAYAKVVVHMKDGYVEDLRVNRR